MKGYFKARRSAKRIKLICRVLLFVLTLLGVHTVSINWKYTLAILTVAIFVYNFQHEEKGAQ